MECLLIWETIMGSHINNIHEKYIIFSIYYILQTTKNCTILYYR